MIVVWDTGFAYVTWNRMFFMMIGMQKRPVASSFHHEAADLFI